MFPWNLFSPKNNQFADWMKNLNGSGLENQMENFLSQLSSEQLNSFKNNDFFSSFGKNHDSDSSVTNQSKQTTSIQLFETHEYVFIRIPISNEESLKHIKVFHTSNKLFIEGLPGTEEKQTIILPAIVRKKGATSDYRDETLEIKLIKYNDSQYSEVSILNQ